MTLRKKILLFLTIIPFILLLIVLVKPIREGDQHNGVELFFLMIGLPVVILNYLEWTDPQLMDEIFGTSRLSQAFGPLSASIESTLARFTPTGLPTWKALAVLVAILAVGIALGAGTISAINQFNTTPTETASSPDQPGPIISAQTREPAGTVQAGETPTVSETSAPALSSPDPILIDPATQIPPSTEPAGATPRSTSAVTPNASRCVSPTQRQLATIQAGINLIDSNNQVQSGYIVKSIAADELWFFAAKVHGPEIEGGVTTEPAVFSFYENNNTPYNIYSINDTALQYADFLLGQLASPPLDMQVDGANDAYDCALSRP